MLLNKNNPPADTYLNCQSQINIKRMSFKSIVYLLSKEPPITYRNLSWKHLGVKLIRYLMAIRMFCNYLLFI